MDRKYVHKEMLSTICHWVVVVQSLSHVQLFATPWIQHAALFCPSLSRRVCLNSCPLSQWCHPTISSSADSFLGLQSFPASGSFLISQLFTSGGQSIGASTSPSNEYSGLISFGIGWFDLLVVQETLKSLLQPPSLKASICWHSAFFMVQLSHLYMTAI